MDAESFSILACHVKKTIGERILKPSALGLKTGESPDYCSEGERSTQQIQVKGKPGRKKRTEEIINARPTSSNLRICGFAGRVTQRQKATTEFEVEDKDRNSGERFYMRKAKINKTPASNFSFTSIFWQNILGDWSYLKSKSEDTSGKE